MDRRYLYLPSDKGLSLNEILDAVFYLFLIALEDVCFAKLLFSMFCFRSFTSNSVHNGCRHLVILITISMGSEWIHTYSVSNHVIVTFAQRNYVFHVKSNWQLFPIVV